ncbi:MAG: AMIN domain-containing protein [Terriglobales bacterium]|jgi:AMIN domain-containing protein
MSRLSYLGSLLAVATWLSAPLSAQTGAQTSLAQTSAPNRALNNNARVQHVIVRGSDDAMEVEIQTSGAPVAPNTQAITGPDRIVVDFPGALPAAELRALTVNRGALKGVRSGLFFDNPPITRVVLDLTEARPYQISTSGNAIVVRLASGKLASANLSSGKSDSGNLGAVTAGLVKLNPVAAVGAKPTDAPATHAAKLQTAALVGSTNSASTNAVVTNVFATNVVAPRVSAAVSQTTAALLPAVIAPPPPKPLVTVTYANGMLRIRAEKATLSQVLFEVQRQTQAEIAIPAGAEQEQVIADLGPAPARDVLSSLLNGTSYNFIFVGNELSLERVILTRRNPNIF